MMRSAPLLRRLLTGTVLGVLLLLWGSAGLLAALNPPSSTDRPLRPEQLAAQLSALPLPAPVTVEAVSVQPGALAQAWLQDGHGTRHHLYLDPVQGTPVTLRAGWLAPLAGHAQRWAAPLRAPLPALALLAFGYLLVCRPLWRRRPPLVAASGSALVCYGSQSGTAEALAQRSAALLGDLPCLPLNAVTADQLRRLQQLWVVTSTYGEGDAPDNAALFAKTLAAAGPLPHLHYQVLGLGDHRYQQFCGYAAQLDQALAQAGATPQTALLCMAEREPQVWQRWLSTLGSDSDGAPLPLATWQPARLSGRTLLNPGSAGGGLYHITLTPHSPLSWQAGDVVEIACGDDADSVRAYSIASLPSDGVISLLVRQLAVAPGQLGLGSGLLTEHWPLNQEVRVRVRTNSGFHSQPGPAILIGSGTGLAGLLGHLRQRGRAHPADTWLLWGERNAAVDDICAVELAEWAGRGVQIDKVFSRDGHPLRYVQELLPGYADQLDHWLQRGATLYVCGSLDGMGAGVDQTLRSLFGAERIDQLLAAGRYRRDLY